VTQPRYETIRQALRASILRGAVPTGLVLIEGPIAELFGTSRAPVRKAMELLNKEGLIRKFDGRGFLVSPAGVEVQLRRLPLNRQTLGLEAAQELVDHRWTSEKVFDDMLSAVSTCVVFGHFKLVERAAAEYYGVSRATVREALIRLRDYGLIESNPYSHWLAGPLTARSVADDYDLRVTLEPIALRQSAPFLERPQLLGMLAEIDALLDGSDHPDLAHLNLIEQSLHTDCLAHLKNRKMAAVIRLSQASLVLHRIFFSTLRRRAERPMLIEHRFVVELLLQGSFAAATTALEHHLRKAAERALQRLKVLSVLPEPELPEYLVRIT
jgi:DNA-binding GntR family transcriptional regulator